MIKIHEKRVCLVQICFLCFILFFICQVEADSIDVGNYYRVDNSDGNVIYADSCSYEDVKAAVEAAKSGDTVRVPSGEAICDSYQDFSWSERWFV